MSSSLGGSEEGEEEEYIIEEDDKVTSSIPEDILHLRHNFGYDCKRLFNLTLIDDDTLIFASGKFIHYFKISTGEVTFRNTVFGHGIGFIMKNENPLYEGLLTIGENGRRPTVFIYEYPSYDIRVKLEGGAKALFTAAAYNSTGELLATHAGHPDFMMTIWRWEKAEVVLRSKSNQNDVLFIHFSLYNPILLVSCGLSHIKFWKMANTFTGLKLKGDLGRFGKTDFSDIFAVYMLSDENVISGCDWGNMLLWEAGLIKFEICRKGRKPCHLKAITRITYDDGEVMTVGMDGYVRIWYWETVDLADPPDDDRFVEIEPIYEFQVKDCEIRSVQKIKLHNKKDFGYYAQDGNGGIWYCDFNTDDAPATPRKLYSCHGGKVLAAQLSPISTHLMTLGEDGKIFTYDYAQSKFLMENKFDSHGNDLLWFNTFISNNGMELVAGFNNGILRQLLFDLSNTKMPKLHLIRAIKAHTAAITKLAVNPNNTILATGSMDQTVFLYSLTEKSDGLVLLQPMGFINFNGMPNCLNWKRDKESIIVIGGKSGEVYEYKLPKNVTEEQTFLSYRLTEGQQLKSFKFASIKSRIRRDIKREQIKNRKELKRQRKLAEIEKLKEVNPGLQINLQTALADSEEDEEEEPLHIPAKPNPVLWLKYTEDNTIWISMGGYDAGYIYEVVFGYAEPVRSTIIADGDDCEIHSYLEIEEFLLFGMINGNIRVNCPNMTDFRDLTDYRVFRMHDELRGNIPRVLKSFDGNHLVSIGHDGNVFIYDWNGPQVVTESGPIQLIIYAPLEYVDDIDDPEHPSLEQEKIYAEQKRQEEAAAEHDRQILIRIEDLQLEFDEIMKRNLALPHEIQIPHRNLLLDPRITKQIGDELQAELDDVRDDLAYDLEVAQLGKKKMFEYFIEQLDHIPIRIRGIRKIVDCFSFRLKKLGPEFYGLKREIDERLFKESQQRGPAQLKQAESHEDSMPEPGIESFFFGRDPDSIIPRFSKKMLRILKRYRGRQMHEIERVYEWDKLYRRRPDPEKNHPDDDASIREAERTLGDYKLKTNNDYEPESTENLTHKAIQIVKSREQLYEIVKQFNDRLFALRLAKKQLLDFIAKKQQRLEVLHKMLPEPNRKYLSPLPQINMDEEYPEINLIENMRSTCGIEIEDILSAEKIVADFLPVAEKPPPKEKLPQKRIDELDIYYTMRVYEVERLPEFSELMLMLEDLPRCTETAYFEATNNATPWLIERRYQWLIQLIIEQENIITTVEQKIQKFDKQLKEISSERLQVKFEGHFLQSHMITLNQELLILRDSEEIENQLLANADEAMRNRNDMQTLINTASRQSDEARKACDRLNEQISVVQVKFMSTTKGHKFFDFLRRIFKKKYKPPKPPKVGDESSESSSDDDESSSEDENADTKSIDSADMTTIRLDETHCPPGLERNMYELAFKLRADRHALEYALLEQQKIIEAKRQEINQLQKRMRQQEEVYAKENNTLLDFRRKRQQELNKVKTSVVLSMSQMQHFEEGEDFKDLTNAVLFNAAHLNRLKDRVNQLNLDTLETKRWHRVNIVHLTRMDKDIKFMRFEIIRLEEEIKDAMQKKFGMVLNLNDLEEEVLRRHVFELETSAEEEIRELEREMAKRTLELTELQDQLIQEMRIKSEKLNIFAVLQEEKNFLESVLDAQEKNFEKFFKPHTLNLDHDIEKLEVIDRQQKEQIQCLEREICTLRMKSKPLQIERSDQKEVEVTTEVLPNDNAYVCPELLATDIYPTGKVPDDFTMDRVSKIVRKYFVRTFTSLMSKDLLRKYSYKVTRYLGHAAYNFEGKLTTRILDCLIEQLQTILPKKYLLHLSSDELEHLFQEILEVFDYERSEVNTEDLISGIFAGAMETLDEAQDTLNKTQHIIEQIFQQLVEVLPQEAFLKEETLNILVSLLEQEKIFEPKSISIERLVESVCEYSRANLLDTVTTLTVRRLAVALQKELIARRTNMPAQRCSIGSVSTVSITSKKN